MELRGKRVLSLWIMLVHFPLKCVVRFGIGEETEENARKGARDRIRSCDNGKYTVVDEVTPWRRWSFRLILIVLNA